MTLHLPHLSQGQPEVAVPLDGIDRQIQVDIKNKGGFHGGEKWGEFKLEKSIDREHQTKTDQADEGFGDRPGPQRLTNRQAQ